MNDTWIIGKIEICQPGGGPLLEYELRLAPTGALEELQRRIKLELADRDRLVMVVREETDRIEALYVRRLDAGRQPGHQPHSDH